MSIKKSIVIEPKKLSARVFEASFWFLENLEAQTPAERSAQALARLSPTPTPPSLLLLALFVCGSAALQGFPLFCLPPLPGARLCLFERLLSREAHLRETSVFPSYGKSFSTLSAPSRQNIFASSRLCPAQKTMGPLALFLFGLICDTHRPIKVV